jgi:hypothetical protein
LLLWLRLESSLFVPPFPPLLGALFNQVDRGFITFSKLKALNKYFLYLTNGLLTTVYTVQE